MPVMVKIWDMPLRLFHWLVLVAVAIDEVTGWWQPVSWLELHLIAGVGIACLLLFRLVWGFTGTAYSRFSSFVFAPSYVIDHLLQLRNGQAPRDAGHNPLGAQMVFALLGILALIVASGTAALGGALKQGPFRSFTSFAAGWFARDVHSLLAIGLLVLIAGHVGGVILESWRTSENLAASMVSGRKRPGFNRVVLQVDAKVAPAVLAFAFAGGFAWASVHTLSQLPPSGVPAFAADSAWARECSACHIAFHPSLLPSASWNRIMDGLSNHFGEDASLDAASVAEIKSFLAMNAAEQWDTLPANRLKTVDAGRPLEITANRFWIHMHSSISGAVFASRPVGAKQNCAACHADAASGLFAPQSISVPKEATQ